MINPDRVVPITRTDLISLYALIVGSNDTLTVVDAVDADGNFEVSEVPDEGSLFASEPVSTLDLPSGEYSVGVYFVPAYDYAGFTKDGEAVNTTGDVEANGVSLYLASYADGAVEITRLGY